MDLFAKAGLYAGLAIIKSYQIPLAGGFGKYFNILLRRAAAGWCDTIENFGSGTLTLAQILEPAIQLAEQVRHHLI